MNKTRWRECVRLAKTHVDGIENNQLRIAELAILACDIQHGGNKTKDTYTLRKFAKEIGVNPKTLGGWINLKVNVYEKAPKKVLKDMSFTQINKVGYKVKKSDSRARVVELLKKEKGKPKSDVLLENLRKSLRYATFHLESSTSLKNCSKTSYVLFVKECEALARLARGKLTAKKKRESF